MFENLQEFVASLPTVLQWAGVLLASAIPFVESYFGSVLGIIAGLPPALAIGVAIVGNALSMFGFVLAAHGVRTKAVSGREPKELSPRRMKLKEKFDKYGVAGVSLLGQTILPSQITSAAMVSFGAPKNVVILWQCISITIWGVLFGVLATMGISLAR